MFIKMRNMKIIVLDCGLISVLSIAALFFMPMSGHADDSLVFQGKKLNAWITEAGNEGDDEKQLAILRKLLAEPGLPEPLHADLQNLIEGIDKFTHSPRLDYFDSQIRKKRDWNFGLAEDSPFKPLTYYYRARMILWVSMEHGGIWSVPKERRLRMDQAAAFLQKANAAFPENRIVRMYLGEPIPCEPVGPDRAGAPEWAVYQREGLERIADIIEWWIDNRLQENGEYGGGWGDDCEMWRWWVPVLVGFDDPKIAGAQARFSRALMAQPHMSKGYSSHLTDVEHSAEDSADAVTPMMHLEPDNPEWRNLALSLVDMMENLWSGRNKRGFLQYKSIDFSSEKVSDRTERAFDTCYHPRALQPALLYWQRTGDTRCGKLFSAWMDTWADAAQRAENGKPAGIVPSAIHWPDGGAGGTGPDWWNPENTDGASLYRWPSALDMTMHTLLLAHHMTGEEKYFAPIRSMAEIQLKYLDHPQDGTPTPGTEAWCASRYNLRGVLAKHRLLTGTQEFDRILNSRGGSYLAFRMQGERDGLVNALKINAQALSINFPGYTREVRYTDRVLRFPTLYHAGVLFEDANPDIKMPNPALLYSTVTGDPGGARLFSA